MKVPLYRLFPVESPIHLVQITMRGKLKRNMRTGGAGEVFGGGALGQPRDRPLIGTHVSEAGAQARDESRRVDLSVHELRQPCLSRQLRTERVRIGVANEIHAHGLREDTGYVSVRRPV